MSLCPIFHCTPCGTPHAGECPPKVTAKPQVAANTSSAKWPAFIQKGQRFRWVDGVHVVGDVDADGKRFVLLVNGDPNATLEGWDVIHTPNGCYPAGALEFVP